VTSSSLSLAELVKRGTAEIAHYRGRAHPPASPLEWLGIAVAQLPELTASARTADDVSGRSRPAAAATRAPLLDALADHLGCAAATIEQARKVLAERHPGSDPGDRPEEYSELIEMSQRDALRRSEMMIGAYASFLGGAVEAAGGLADAELGIALARRWDREDHQTAAQVRAGQLHAALVNALGGLLAYARLLAADAERLRQ
jgi:DNA-binding transcriptional MocR family regulator